MLRKFPSLELPSRLAGRFRAVQREAGLPCSREPSVETLGKGLRGIQARILSPAGARLSEAVAFTLGDGEKTIFWPFLCENPWASATAHSPLYPPKQSPPKGLHMLG